MEYLQNGYTLNIAPGTFPLSTDSVLLADFSHLSKNASVLDLGSGCGTLGLLLCANDSNCSVTGVEIDPAAHETALENISRNSLSSRLKSICADLNTIPQLFPSGSFHCVVSNPPYFPSGPVSKTVPIARREDMCDLPGLFTAASWAVKYGGDFYLVHRPERLAQICACAADTGMEVKRLCTVRHDPASPVNLILLQCRKGAKPGLIWEELCLFDQNGDPTAEYKHIYHI